VPGVPREARSDGGALMRRVQAYAPGDRVEVVRYTTGRVVLWHKAVPGTYVGRAGAWHRVQLDDANEFTVTVPPRRVRRMLVK